MRVLVAGGAGYIGSHTCVELIERGHEVLILDNLCNASPRVLERIAAITGRRPDFVEADVRDARALAAVFRERPFDVVIHFAALKAVGESWEKPLAYFDNNITGTIVLLQAMRDAGVNRLVFSSSATVYGDPDACPIPESAPLRVTNPYGRTKLVMEELIGDLGAADPAFRAAVLRYFNPVGAHPSGLIGEDPAGAPNNLMPYVCQVAVGRRPYLNVFGNDYPTRDGTGVRDYLHVVDLARAHVDAIDALARTGAGFTVNLGTGTGYSVLEVVRAFEAASGRPVPVRFAPRRAGDVAACYADPSLAERLMGWKAELGLERMCADAWRWQSANPRGYAP
ncbi:udp-glucose 4-epimerase protein [Mizugakiibacter sediminis]|uniref:UDP-glucose 4-epimerase n=1 Tax=Mizugakiibacter sediminis TaxID=1475481 RepID=A0A0K8QL67_9GAMM|nr:UDP-glucose 4-epimerase GalE [Mizugakiibacter sediminis]GAP65650.1 udp-glucose 4-epimerase protein [Mizugakiibacter sediminis]